MLKCGPNLQNVGHWGVLLCSRCNSQWSDLYPKGTGRSLILTLLQLVSLPVILLFATRLTLCRSPRWFMAPTIRGTALALRLMMFILLHPKYFQLF